jgi:hypothetical protein
MHRLTTSSALTLLLLLAGGCAANPIKAWQAHLEAYVVEQGNGDLNVLRRPDRKPSENDFTMIGASHGGVGFIAPVRTDANGVLLGLRRFREHHWYVYLVGTVEYRGSFVDFPMDDPELTDIRLAAVTGAGGDFEWLISEPNAEALARYIVPQVDAWRASHPSRDEADAAPTRFPTPGDDFHLDVGPRAIAAQDRHSGAAWTLPLESADPGP